MPEKASSSNAGNARNRLLEAAMDVFGRYGYESATTRMIAGEAGVNIAAIPYYFSGKEGLYHAAVTHIIEKIELQLGPIFKEIADLLPNDNGENPMLNKPPGKPVDNPSADGNKNRRTPLGLLETLLGKLITFMIGSPEPLRYARILLREQLYPTSAYDIILKRLFSPMVDSIARVVSILSGEISPHDAKLRATAILGQVMIFRVARETMVRMLNMEGYSLEETDKIRRMVLEQTRAIIGSLKHAERADNNRMKPLKEDGNGSKPRE